MTQSVEQRIAELLDAIPIMESSARQLQRSRDPVAEDSGVQSFRDQYLSWYARCLTVVPDDLQAKFKDFYEGGSFLRRIRHFLEAPTQRNSLVAADPSLASNPLVPYWANAFENTFAPSLLGQRQILQQSLEAARSSVGPAAAIRVEEICRRFPLVVRELHRRHDGRPAIPVDDEYDVQDLIRALLVATFDDVRPEEWTPSYAGGYSKDLPPDLWAVQTPQGFDAQLVLQGHYLAMADGFQGVDTAAVVNRTGHQVRVVEGHCRNFKITTREDLVTAELVLREMPPWDAFLQL